MIENRDIICISPGYWDSPWITHQQIMKCLSRSNRVLYVEPPISYLPIHYPERWNKFTAFSRGMRRENENLWITCCPPAPPLKRTFNAMNRAGQRIVSSWTGRAARKLDFSDPILWIFLPTAVELVGKFDESFVLYHCIDEFTAVRWGRTSLIVNQERDLLSKADLTVTCSEKVYDDKKRYAHEIINVPNAVDFDHYFKAQSENTLVPNDMKSFQKSTVIGFSGVLDDRLDENFLLNAAETYKDYQFVLVGPARKSFPELERRPNIHLLGNRPLESLPGYFKAFNVCMIPYKLNDFVLNISPTKLYEYLAAGRPVVAPEIRALNGLKDMVYVGQNSDDMVQLLAVAVNDDESTATHRTELARENTWQDRADTISERIIDLTAVSIQ